MSARNPELPDGAVEGSTGARSLPETLAEARALEEAREAFISQWGVMGSAWGINRTMAQVHALLLTTPRALSTDEVMHELAISRGNANTNLRELVAWGLVHSFYQRGDRKEYFAAEKDTWKMFGIISRERKRREVEPALATLEHCRSLTHEGRSEEAREFNQTVSALAEILSLGDRFLERVSQMDKDRILPQILKLLARGGKVQ
jgi:DNA-binding transcriptional regulator GbsR (MarR family)